MSSYAAWKKLYKTDDNDDEDWDKDDVKVESEDENTETAEIAEKNETLENIKKLCRICSSKGIVDIHSTVDKTCLRLKKPTWQKTVTIAEIISELSSEQVTRDDLLPQFICLHCLEYLKHAKEMRIKILTNSANLRQAAQVASEESSQLENTHIDQSRIVKREIEDSQDDAKEEGHFYDKFKDANIQITSKTTTQYCKKAKEHNCPSCKKRCSSIKSLNQHMTICEISLLSSFFTSFQTIYSMKCSTKLTANEFIMQAFRLVFDTQKKLQVIATIKNIDVNAISSSESYIPENFDLRSSPQMTRNYRSPDNGYVSESNGASSSNSFTPR